jgi:hypothetical protein
VGVFRRWLIRLGPLLGSLTSFGLTIDRPYHVLFVVDDTVFVREFGLREVQDMLNAYPRALGFSLRLGTNTRYCYPLDKPQAIPAFTHLANDVMMFDWSSLGKDSHDFGYPLEVSSSAYRASELVSLLSRLAFENPNTLERQMAANADLFCTRNPCLLCYERSVAFSIPINRVQRVYKNRAAETPEYSAECLAKMFDDGYRIKVEVYSGFVPNGCHQEVELFFERRLAGPQGAS